MSEHGLHGEGRRHIWWGIPVGIALGVSLIAAMNLGESDPALTGPQPSITVESGAIR